ncbi:MAG: SPOR domain-containing protein [Desulfobacteraceae bacterium]|nr:MAG: SPOR domain-containing protein [Desulfobacteraceae bacterium]
MSRMKIESAAMVLLAFLITGTPCLAGNLYSIQIAAAPDKVSAEQIAEQMNRMGHDSFVRLEDVPGKGRWYRVYVERFGSKPQADREVALLKSLGLLNECFVRELKEIPGTRPSSPWPVSRPLPKPVPQKPETDPKHRAGFQKTAEPPAGLHFLHVASFKEKTNAEKSLAFLEKKGQKVFFTEEGSGANKWFRTYIGEFPNSEEAMKAGARLKEKGFISYYKVISFSKGGAQASDVQLTKFTAPNIR